MSLKAEEIFSLIQATDRVIQASRDYDFRARSAFYQEGLATDRPRNPSRSSGLFFEIVSFLSSYFFSQLPEVLVETKMGDELGEARRAVLEDLANELSSSREFFHALKNSVVDCLLGGLGIFCAKPIFSEGNIVSVSPVALSLQDVVFDPRLEMKDLPFICVRETTSISKLERRFGVELQNFDKNIPARFYFFFDFNHQELVVLSPLNSKEILRVPFSFDQAKVRATDLFSFLTFCPPNRAVTSGRFLDAQEAASSVLRAPFVSLYRVLEDLLRSYDSSLRRYFNLLDNIRHIGIVDQSVKSLIQALEVAEEGQLITANLIGYFNQSKGTDLIYTLPLERLLAGLAQLENAIRQVQLQIYERAGIPDVQAATKVSAENIMQITPFLVDARYAVFIKDIDYFIADAYKNYINMLLRVASPQALLERIRTVVGVADYNQQFRIYQDLTTMRSKGMSYEITTETLAFNRLEKHKIQIRELIEQQIAGISQIVNSLSASPAVGASIARALVELSSLYKIGRRQRDQLQSAFMGIVENLGKQGESGLPEEAIRLKELELKEQELMMTMRIKEQELLLKQKQIELAGIEAQVKSEMGVGKQDLEALKLELQDKKLEIEKLKQDIEAQKAVLQFELERQNLELQTVRTEVENLNKVSDNARLEQEAQMKARLNALQLELMERLLAKESPAPQINITNQVPARKKIFLNPTESGLVAEVQEDNPTNP